VAQDVLLVTGATGLVGSNVCRLAVEAGYRVRGLVRSTADCEPLLDAGVELVTGDVSDAGSVLRAAGAARGIIHTAALLGGTWASASAAAYHATNYLGTSAVLSAGRQAGVERTVCLSTIAIFDRWRTLTEEAQVLPIGAGDTPYVRAKRSAFYEGMLHASLGQHVAFVVPGCVYGPSLLVERSLDPTSFTGSICAALNGRLTRYLDTPMMWAYSLDVAVTALRALERGRCGARYLAVGRAQDAMSLPDLSNRAADIAGLPARVENDASGTPGRYGSMSDPARRVIADPMSDSARTAKELDFTPTAVDDALAVTVSWLRTAGKLPAPSAP